MSQLMLDWERTDDSGIVMHDPGQLAPGPWQPRRSFVETKIAELARSIAEVGVLQNLVAQRPDNGGPALIVSGESRWRAASRVPGARLPVRLVDLTPAQCLTISLIENLGRNDLTALEEAAGYAKYREYEPEITQVVIARRVGKDQSHIASMLGLLQLPDEVRELINDGIIAWSLARDQLVRWAKEEAGIRDRFFRALLTYIAARPDPKDVVTRVWLSPVVTKLAEIYVTCAPAPAAVAATKGEPAASAAKSAPKPAPKPSATNTINALTNHKIEASSFKGALNNASIDDCQAVLKVVRTKMGQKKRVAAIEKRLKELQAARRASAKKKKPAAKRTKQEDIEAQADQPPRQQHMMSPSDEAIHRIHTDTVHTCVFCGCTDMNACEGGCGWLATDPDRKLGVCSACAENPEAAKAKLDAHLFGPPAQENQPENIPEAFQEDSAEPAPEPPGGLVGALLPLLDDCTITLAIARLVQPSETICIIVTPKRIGHKHQIAPLTLSGEAAAIEAELLAKLPAYITNLLGETPAAQEAP
ncbi:MAG: ParB/RepB/Spo0J family partition protein [Longimicrobiales bacterium]